MNQDKKEFFISMIQGLDKKHGELLDHVALMLLKAVRKEREYEIPEEFKFKPKSKEEILKRDKPFDPFPVIHKST